MTKQIGLSIAGAWLIATCMAGSAPPVASATQTPKGTNVNSDAKILADFKARVDAYGKLRDDMAKGTPPLKRTDEPADISLAERAVAQKIRVARATAKPGDILTPATQAMFRRLLAPSLKGSEGPENRKTIKEDAPDPEKIPFRINGEYPKTESLSTMPPDVLKALPALPEFLQYRFVGKHMLLYCSRGNLIVDYMLDAVP